MGSNHNDLEELLHVLASPVYAWWRGTACQLATGVIIQCGYSYIVIGRLSNIWTIALQQCHLSFTTYCNYIQRFAHHVRRLHQMAIPVAVSCETELAFSECSIVQKLFS